jgi:hypothetical protein
VTTRNGSAAFAIPKAHKEIRESIAEWKRIFRELKALYSWIRADRAAPYPDAYLLVALEHLSVGQEAKDVVFRDTMRLPEDNPDLHSGNRYCSPSPTTQRLNR